MITRVTCTACQAPFNAPEKLLGKTVRCPECKAKFRLPEPEAVAEDLEIVSEAAAEKEPSRPSERKKRRDDPERDEREGDETPGERAPVSAVPVLLLVGLGVGVLMLFVLAGGLLAWSYLGSGPNKDMAQNTNTEGEGKKNPDENPEPPTKEPATKRPPAREPVVIEPPLRKGTGTKEPMVKDPPVKDPPVTDPPSIPAGLKGWSILLDKAKASPPNALPPQAVARLGTTAWRLGDVGTFAPSPDGTRLAVSLPSQNRVELWDAKTGAVLSSKQGSIGQVRFLPDGKQLIYEKGFDDYALWDIETGKAGATLAFKKALRSLMVCSRDGKWLVGCEKGFGEKTPLTVWELPDRRVALNLEIPLKVAFLALTHDGKQLAVAGSLGEVIVYEIPSGQEKMRLKAAEESLLAFTADDKQLVSVSQTNTDTGVMIWDLANPGTKTQFRYNGRPKGLSPDGKILLAVSGNLEQTRLWAWSVPEKKRLHMLANHPDSHGSGVFSTNGQTFCLQDRSHILRVWDVVSGEEFSQASGHKETIARLQFLEDGKTIVSTGYQGSTRYWDFPAFKEPRFLAQDGAAEAAIAVAPSGQSIYAYDELANPKIFNLEAKTALPVGDKLAQFGSFSLDGKQLALTQSVAGSEQVQIYDPLKPDKPLRSVVLPTNASRVLFSPDGKRLAIGSGVGRWHNASDDDTQVIDPVGGKLLRKLVGRPMAWTPRGLLITGEATGILHVWNAETGAEVKRFPLADTPYSAASSLDGAYIAVGLNNDIAWINANTGKEVARVKGHASIVESLIFSPDGKHLVSGGEDTTILVWDVARLGK